MTLLDLATRDALEHCRAPGGSAAAKALQAVSLDKAQELQRRQFAKATQEVMNTPESWEADAAMRRECQDLANAPRPVMTRDQANAKAMQLAKADRSFVHKSQREWADAIGCSDGLVTKLPLWQATMKKTGRGRKVTRPKVVTLTQNIETVTPGRDEDPADLVATDEIMRKLIEDATPEERAKLNNLTPEQRRELAETVENDPDRERSPLDNTPTKRFGQRKRL